MTKSLIQDALGSNLLLSPLVYSLIENFSFKDEFLAFCSSLPESLSPVISWHSLQSFFEKNNWNWKSFCLSNLHIIMAEQGFLLSSDIDKNNIPLDPLEPLFLTFNKFAESKIIFDQEMLSFLETIFHQSSNDLSKVPDSSSMTTVPSSTSVSSLNGSSNKITINHSISISDINLSSNIPSINSSTFEQYYLSRFQQLDTILKNMNHDSRNRPKNPSTITEIELNERIFITGLIVQTSLTSTHLYSTKLQLINPLLNCIVIASISIQQQSKIPLGMVIGVIGKVVDLEYVNNDKPRITISSENWFYPGIQSTTKKTPPKTSNESWVVLIGSFDLSNEQFSNVIFSKLNKWFQTIHDNFRIGYCVFCGGVLSENDVPLNSELISNFQNEKYSYKSKYSIFNSFIEKIPKNIQIFIVPSNFDLTNNFLPQPGIYSTYRSKKENIHYLQNPNFLTLEDRNLLIYNPFQFSTLDQFVMQPEKFGIDLLNFRHLCPIWSEDQNISFPYMYDSLLIPNDLDFFVLNHPSKCVLSNYKNINLLSISAIKDVNSKEIPILIFNLHTQERKVIKISLDV